MPYFSISNKYPAPTGSDPSMRHWMNGLPLSTIQGEVEGGNFSPGPALFTQVNQDTASFFPILSGGSPVNGLTVPAQAGGLYVYSIYCKWTVAAGIPTTGQVRALLYSNARGATKVPGIDPPTSTEWVRSFRFRAITPMDFLYLNPGDELLFYFSITGPGSPKVERAVFRFARIAV